LPFKYSEGTLGTFGLTPEPVAFEWLLERALILAMSRILSFSLWLSLFPPVSLLMPLLIFSRVNDPLDSVADVGVVWLERLVRTPGPGPDNGVIDSPVLVIDNAGNSEFSESEKATSS
jgi:hypothetical protein